MALAAAKTLATWGSGTPQGQSVERDTDSLSYEAAHPDDTLILAGPPRYSQLDPTPTPVTGASGSADKFGTEYGLLPIGMVQQISFQQSKPTQPLMAVGSGRSFFTSGKAQTSWTAARLWVKGPNLLKVMYAWSRRTKDKGGKDLSTKLQPAAMNDIAAVDDADDFYTNLDSELYYMPFGMMCLFRDKVHDYLGAFYVELCMIGNWGSSVTAGSSQIMESVSGMADRILPIELSQVGAAYYANREAAAAIVGLTTGSVTSASLNADNGGP